MVLTATGHYIKLIRAGRKTSTVRLVCKVQAGQRLTFTNYRQSVRTICTGVEERAVRTLTERDAQADGFDCLHDLLAALHHHYPALDPNATVWVVRFELLPDSAHSVAAAR